ncbi:hypothetical protein SKB07_16140, partial [Enterococcus faecium]
NNQVLKIRLLLLLPVVAEHRTSDRFKPWKRLESRPEALPKTQIFRTVRGIKLMLSATTSS